MKKYSKDAKELLSTVELYEVKAGENKASDQEISICNSSCMACTTCVACSSRMMDVIIVAK